MSRPTSRFHIASRLERPPGFTDLKLLLPVRSLHLFAFYIQPPAAIYRQCRPERLPCRRSTRFATGRRAVSCRIRPGSLPPNTNGSRPCLLPSSGANAPLVQDPESSSGPPTFLLKLTNDDELVFKFTFIIRQTAQASSPPSAPTATDQPALDTRVNALTYVYASSPREVETLVTREFHADPNLHKNANVALVGDYSTDGSSSVTFEWTWTWKPPKKHRG